MTGRWLVDASTIFRLRRTGAPPGFARWLDARRDAEFLIGASTLADVRAAIERVGDAHKRRDLNDWLDRLALAFDARVLPVSADVLLRWHQLIEPGSRAEGMAPPDALVAATALQHHCAILACGDRGYRAVGIATHDPWDEVPPIESTRADRPSG
ncbi:MAG: PIN domain-containing protein [Lautropia sp.]